MFRKHYNIAVDGIRAGHRMIAKLGFGFQIEIIVTSPEVSGGGGGWYPPYPQPFQVTVKITRKEKVWQQSFSASEFTAKSVEKIVLTLKSINRAYDYITFSISKPFINIKKIVVGVFKK